MRLTLNAIGNNYQKSRSSFFIWFMSYKSSKCVGSGGLTLYIPNKELCLTGNIILLSKQSFHYYDFGVIALLDQVRISTHFQSSNDNKLAALIVCVIAGSTISLGDGNSPWDSVRNWVKVYNAVKVSTIQEKGQPCSAPHDLSVSGDGWNNSSSSNLTLEFSVMLGPEWTPSTPKPWSLFSQRTWTLSMEPYAGEPISTRP